MSRLRETSWRGPRGLWEFGRPGRAAHLQSCPRPLVDGSVGTKTVFARSSGVLGALSPSTLQPNCRRLSEQRNLVTRDGPPDAHFRRMSGVMQEESGPRTHIARTSVVRAGRFREVCARGVLCWGVFHIESVCVGSCAPGGSRHSAFVIRHSWKGRNAEGQRGSWR